jgi:hypothetical protein
MKIPTTKKKERKKERINYHLEKIHATHNGYYEHPLRPLLALSEVESANQDENEIQVQL